MASAETRADHTGAHQVDSDAHDAPSLRASGVLFGSDPPGKRDRKTERNVKKLKSWVLLSVAGVLAVLIGNRLEEAVVLDRDNMGGAR
jgi:hypothetical protein